LLNSGAAALERLSAIIDGTVTGGQCEFERKRSIVEAAVQPV